VLAHLRACPASTASGVLECFIGLWRQSVLASGGSSGCPVAGVAIDTGSVADGLIEAAHAAFSSWTAYWPPSFRRPACLRTGPGR